MSSPKTRINHATIIESYRKSGFTVLDSRPNEGYSVIFSTLTGELLTVHHLKTYIGAVSLKEVLHA